MTDPAATLAHVSNLVHAELAQYLSNEFVIAKVTSEFWPSPTAKTTSGPPWSWRTGIPNWTTYPQQILHAHELALQRTEHGLANHRLRQQERDAGMTTSAQPVFQFPEPISWTDLIAAGRATLIPQPPATQPTQAAIRRAISAAYYAAFHALTTSNADALIGPVHDQLTADLWIRTYRSLNTAMQNPNWNRK